MLFMAGCVHKPSLKNLNYQAFDVTVEPGMKR